MKTCTSMRSNPLPASSELSWSLLDPRPVLKYIEECDEYIVYWNGAVMPHLMALNLAMEEFGIYPSPSMKLNLTNNYKKIYYSDGFGTRAWDNIAATGNPYNYLKRYMYDHIHNTIEKYAKSDVLGWFNYNRARNTSNDN